MGYRRERTIYKLIFEGTQLAGLEVQATSIPTGQLLKLMRLAGGLEQGNDGRAFSDADVQAVDELFAGFAKALVSWNLEDEDDAPVPATLEALREQDFEFVMPVVSAWIQAVAGVSPDLGKDSNSGGTSLEQSIPMDV